MATPGNRRDRRVAICAGLAIVATTTGCSAAPDSRNSVQSAQVDSLFRSTIRPDAPGCAVGVYRSGEIVLARGYGVASIEDGRPLTSRSTFNLGSASKPFTALAALMLVERGQLALDDDVRRWVPELPDYGRPIRVFDLLQHTSGLRDFGTLEVLAGRDVTTQTQFLRLIASQRGLNFEPGTRHEYSHTDFGVLGLIIQRVVGVPFGQHMQQAVFAPLGMHASFVDDRSTNASRDRAFGHSVSLEGPSVEFPSSQTFGGDNVYASVEDLARFDRNFEEPIVGGAATIARMLSRPVLPSGDTIPYAYGLRLGVYRGLKTIWRRGHPPGTHAVFLRFPEQRFTVATLCNSDDLEAPRLAERVADIYLGAAMSPASKRAPAPTAVVLPPDALAQYAGTYRPIDDPWDVWPIEVRQGVLGEVVFDDATDEVFYPMTPAGDGRFFEVGRTGVVGRFTFRPTASGGPLRLEMSWNDEPIGASERVTDAAIWRPSAVASAEYAGFWSCPDLDAGWQLEARGAKLVLRRPGQVDLTLRPVARDQYLRGFGPEGAVSARLQFRRDRAGRVSELVVSTPPGEDSVRDLRCTRAGSIS